MCVCIWKGEMHGRDMVCYVCSNGKSQFILGLGVAIRVKQVLTADP